MSRDQRIVLACIAFAAWMGLLMIGWIGGGVVHLLLPLALVIVPWSRL